MALGMSQHLPIDSRLLASSKSLCIALSLLIVSSSNGDSYPTPSGPIEISPQVHSSVQVEYQDRVIQIDPWGAIPADNYKSADLIIVTDSPSHHKDAATIAAISKPATSIIAPRNSAEDLPQAMIMNIGDVLRTAGVTVEAIAAYDIIPGAPEHPLGDANGYVVSLGETRLFFAGVTECVDEVKALADIDIAFLPMNIPVGRMTPQAAADCAKILSPEYVYIYHYDQDWVRRLNNPDYEGSTLPGELTVNESLDRFAEELSGSGINFVRGDWYPTSN